MNPVVISKTIVQQIRIKTLQHNGNKNEDARTSPVVSTNHQLPNSLKTLEHPCWLGRGTPSQSGRIHPVMRVQHTWPICWMLPTRLQRLPEASKYESAVVLDTVTYHMRDLPAHQFLLVLLLFFMARERKAVSTKHRSWETAINWLQQADRLWTCFETRPR